MHRNQGGVVKLFPAALWVVSHDLVVLVGPNRLDVHVMFGERSKAHAL